MFSVSVVSFFRGRTVWSFLQLIGAGCLLVVGLCHVCEAVHLFPWMRWGFRNSAGHYLDLWSAVLGLAGLESYSGSPSTITSGYSNSVGIHIVYIDYQHLVEIQVNSADTIRVHSRAAGGTATGNVTFIW
jgi:hypothetical protein